MTRIDYFVSILFFQILNITEFIEFVFNKILWLSIEEFNIYISVYCISHELVMIIIIISFQQTLFCKLYYTYITWLCYVSIEVCYYFTLALFYSLSFVAVKKLRLSINRLSRDIYECNRV